MSEFSLDLSLSKKSRDFSSIVVSDLYTFCSFVFSNPIYFSYVVFFSPYLLKLFSFLSPLFITTSLLVLALLTVSPGLLHGSRADSETDDDEFLHFRFEELEAYKIVFVGSSFESREEDPDGVFEAKVQEACAQAAFQEEPVDKCVIESEVAIHNSDNASAATLWPEIDLKENDGGVEIVEKEVVPLTIESNKAVQQPSMKRTGSKAIRNKIRESKAMGDEDQYKTPRALERYPSLDSKLGSYGSMRKEEKEWKRTLACKLFEERHNAGGDGGAECMDMLWETHEAESTKSRPKTPKKGTKVIAESHEDNEDDDDDEDDVGVQLCCLQALKFSAGKMNLGMGRPSLVKFSKALKGMGWLHHMSKKSHKQRVRLESGALEVRA